MKKGLIFCLSYYPNLVGGAEVAVKEITDRIGDDFEFDMITLFAGKTRVERIGKITIYRVGPHIRLENNRVPHIGYPVKFYYVAAAFFKSLSLNRKKKYDFIWSIMASFNGFSALFFKILHPKIPFILNLQEGDTPEHIKKATSIMYPVYKFMFRKTDYIHALSTYLADYGRQMGATCPIEVIPNGVDFNFFSATPPQSQLAALRHELGLSETNTILITTSRLVSKNGVKDIIDAMTFLPESVVLLILGTGPLEEMLTEKVRLLKLEKRIQFLGFIANRELPIYLHLSHIFIRPSLSEGMGVSFVEAMAAGLPVIATPVGGIPDFLIDQKTGLFCEVNNPKNIAEKVQNLIKNKDIKNLIISNASDLVKNSYDWELLSFKIARIFKDIS